MDYALRFEKWFLALSVPLGMGRRRSRIRLADDALSVQMGWAFRATIPLASITSIARDESRVFSRGVHGWAGAWLVNGSGQGLVRIEIAPAISARAVGFPIMLSRLTVSAANPGALIAAVRK